MPDLAQMPSNGAGNVGANNFRITGQNGHSSHMPMSKRLEAAALTIPAIGSNILGSAGQGAASLASIPDIHKLQMPMIPSSLKTAMRSIVPPPQFAGVTHAGSGIAKGLVSVALKTLKLG